MATAEQVHTSKAFDVVSAYAEAKSRADADTAVKYCGEDLLVETVPFQMTVRGKELNRLSFAAFFGVFPDYNVELEGWAENANWLTGWGTLRATMNGPIGNVAATGKGFELPFVCVWKVEEGLLAVERFFFDFHQMCEQLGIDTAKTIGELRQAAELLSTAAGGS